MRRDSLERVNNVLAMADRPLTSTELRKATGLSTNTLNVALRELGAQRLHDHYPVKWIKGTGPIDSKLSSVGLADGAQVLVDQIIYDNTVERWESGRMKFGNNLLNIHIEKDSDPAKLAEQFASGASVLASISLALQQVQKDPDWYEKLVH